LTVWVWEAWCLTVWGLGGVVFDCLGLGGVGFDCLGGGGEYPPPKEKLLEIRDGNVFTA